MQHSFSWFCPAFRNYTWQIPIVLPSTTFIPLFAISTPLKIPTPLPTGIDVGHLKL